MFVFDAETAVECEEEDVDESEGGEKEEEGEFSDEGGVGLAVVVDKNRQSLRSVVVLAVVDRMKGDDDARRASLLMVVTLMN